MPYFFLRHFSRNFSNNCGARSTTIRKPDAVRNPGSRRRTALAHFDATPATKAYLAQIPADKTARSDAYFEGGYWLILWDFLYGVVVALLLLNLRWSARMRDLSERVTRFKPVHTFVYWAQYLVLTSILAFPGTVYEDYFREHKYGLATQTFGPWTGDQLKNLAANMVLGGLLAMLLFGIVRRLPRTWWIWGAVVTNLFLIFVNIPQESRSLAAELPAPKAAS